MTIARGKLSEYDRKRRFAETPEPAGEEHPDEPAAPRFVIQEHSATRLHWDLRLEHDGVLVSFAVPNALPWEPGRNHLAVHTEDHPLEYLDFHGEIPKGNYGAGSMTIWDRGTYEVLKWDPRKIEVHLHGERLDARYALFPLDADPARPGKDWMVHLMGEALDPAAGPMPEFVAPMLAKAGRLPPDDGRWAFEVKWDGIRAQVHTEPGTFRLHTRNGNEVTRRYPELQRVNRCFSHHRLVLDGEIVAFDAQGRPAFSAMQARMHLTDERRAKRLAEKSPVTLVLFDVLWVDGHSVVHLPYEERRALLHDLVTVERAPGRVQVPDHVVGHGQAVLDAAAQQGLEGVVAKKLDCPYEPGRRANGWIKVKLTDRCEVVVGGWLPGEGRRRDRIGALLVGVRQDDGTLRYAGRVGTGFTQAELDRLAALLGPLERATSPFDVVPKTAKPPKGSVWVEPHYVAEVEFTEWTPDEVLRHPSYKGLREDKGASGLVVEGDPTRKGGFVGTIEGRTLKLSNLDKQLYPSGFAKRDVIDFYVGIAPALLPHLEGRPLTLKRYPNGTTGDFFYEKNAPSHRPDWVKTGRYGGIEFVVCEDVPTLVWLANLADLELHTSMARVDDPDHPTTLAFDLDPGPPATVVECCRVALFLKAMFGGLGLQCFPKTSGSKGMQVYVPLARGTVTHAQTKSFAKAVAELLEAEEPGLVVSRQTKAIRGGKVLVDWSQNDEHKTTVNVYSLRAKDRPTVSTPVAWEEVEACLASGDPAELEFTAAQVLERVDRLGDLFAPVASLQQGLPSFG